MPLEERASLRLRSRAARSLPAFSVVDLLDGRVPPERVRGKLMVLGATATGLGAVVGTPGGPALSSLEIQADMLEQMVAGDWLKRPLALWAGELLGSLALGLAWPVLWARQRWSWTAPVVLAAAAAAWPLAMLAARSGWLLSALPWSVVLAIQAAVVFHLSAGRRGEMKAARDASLRAMTVLTQLRDVETGAHLQRCQRYIRPLCHELARRERYREMLTKETVDLLVRLVPLHDIGKVGIPDCILRKPGPLSESETAVMRQHVEIGLEMVDQLEASAGLGGGRVYELVRELVGTHHERWDGTGYPDGLPGWQIPLSGRILAVVDAYDALTSQRIYKRATSHEEAVAIISESRGTAFDPEIVDAFLAVAPAWRKVASRHAEEARAQYA
jgi:adenylate cyclase